jgi:hypothetical protein
VKRRSMNTYEWMKEFVVSRLVGPVIAPELHVI